MFEVGRRLVGGVWRTNVENEPTGGNGGSQPADYVQVDDPGAVGAGKTWLQLPPLIDPDPWSAETPYVAQQRVQPTTPNGHYYQANGPGTSTFQRPTVA